MKVIIAKNYKDMSSKAARFVLARLWRKPDLVLGLPTGNTPIGMYEQLAQARKSRMADFSKVKTFNLDEYVGLSEKDADSYASFMEKHFFRKVNIKQKNTYIPNGKANNLESECEQYEKEIANSGRIDLQVLGIGPNGHIGFNEPGTPFAARTHVANLSDKTRDANKKNFKSNNTPEQAITMGLGAIMESKEVLLLASGKEKGKAVAQTIEGKVKKEIPASILQWHSCVTVIADEEAAGELDRSYSSPFLFGPADVELLTEKDLPQGKYVTVISPHPDDASVSLGGMIAALSKKNKVYTVVMTSGYRSDMDDEKPQEVLKTRQREAREESKILGSIPIFLKAEFYDSKDSKSAFAKDTDNLVKIFKRTKPDILFIPQSRDVHPTHKKSREVALSAIKKYSANNSKNRQKQLWEYEGLWSLFPEHEFNAIFSYDEPLMKKKIKAIEAQKSQLSRSRFDVAAKSLARLRATVIPEQALVGYGSKPPKLGKYFELFNITSL